MRRVRICQGRETPVRHAPFPDFEPPDAVIFTPRSDWQIDMGVTANADPGEPPAGENRPLETERSAAEMSAPAEESGTGDGKVTTDEGASGEVAPLCGPDHSDTEASTSALPLVRLQQVALIDFGGAMPSAESPIEATFPLPESTGIVPMECDPPLAIHDAACDSWYEQVVAEESLERQRAQLPAEPVASGGDLPMIIEEDEWERRRAEDEERAAQIRSAEQRAKEADAQRRKEEAERHAAAAEARRSQERESVAGALLMHPEPTLPPPVLRRPHGSASAEPLETCEVMARPDQSKGAIPKKPRIIRVEVLERPHVELQRVDEIPDAEKPIQEVQPLKSGEPPLRILPIEAAPAVIPDGESWDEEAVRIPLDRIAMPEAAAWERWQPMIRGNFVANEAPAPVRTATKKKRGSSERRQWTTDDYVSGHYTTPPRSPEPGPPTPVVIVPPPRQSVQPPSSNPSRTTTTQAPPTSSSTIYPVKRTGIKFGGLVAIPTDPALDPPPFTCFNCWERGHPALRCPLPQQRIFCFNCGRRGVDLSVCPRCSEPHQRYLQTEYAHERQSGGRAFDQREERPLSRPLESEVPRVRADAAGGVEDRRREPREAAARHAVAGPSRSHPQARESERWDESIPERRRESQPNTYSPERATQPRAEENRCVRYGETRSTGRGSVHDRLGPRVEDVSDEEEGTVMDALHIAESLVRYAFGTRRRSHRRTERRDEYERRDR